MEESNFKMDINELNLKRKPFLIKSENLEKLRDIFIEVSDEIKKAITQKRHIIVRHHDDTDGYIAGFTLEKAILPLIEDNRKYYYFTRLSSRTPFYEYTDALRDVNSFLSFTKICEFLFISQHPMKVQSAASQ